MRAEAFDWLMRVQAAPGDSAMRAARDAWLAESEAHRNAYCSVERMWRVAGMLPLNYAEQVRGGASAKPAATAHRLAARRGSRVWRNVGLAAVALATCLALVFLPALQLRLAADHLTGVAELRDLTLEDGSTVHLDAGSAIAVRYGPARRDVRLLSGQALFEVVAARDRPFVVIVGDVTVTVTGTAFAVRSSADTVSVAVQSGTVEVALDRGRRPAATLTRGQQLDVDRASGRVATREVAPEDVAAWRERRLVVDGATLADVVDELGRHYDGVIVLRDRSLAGRRITGVFDLGRPIEALHAVVGTQHGSIVEITPYLIMLLAR